MKSGNRLPGNRVYMSRPRKLFLGLFCIRNIKLLAKNR
ncbi:hypothetical protein HMPREF0868_1492 [Mageeibacillus indolicus UPII9-5]|uniref:Uncharacterized protein n=1 Tax=Mageeibacillus indolicus (strain UPII9-5) TaxID=699246 RepID=D3QZ56_MAGIU|nr:hypothetical protein HMPREF0868_1492 [Mageeibacillus indolicus UPII9-5]